MDIDRYKLLILPDDIKVSPEFKKKLDNYISQGGKVLLTGSSGFDESNLPLFDIGADCFGKSDFCPDYIEMNPAVCPDFISTPLVMYMTSNRIKTTVGKSLGKIFEPYFNREARHFSSHQHTPYKTEESGFDCGVINGNLLYLAHPVFSIYRWYGGVAYKEYICNCIDLLLDEDKTLETNLPSTARISFMNQQDQSRFILHLLYAEKITRGGNIDFLSSNIKASSQIEIIEHLLPLSDIKIKLTHERPIKKALLQPQGQELEVTKEDGAVKFNIDSFTCHAMIELQY